MFVYSHSFQFTTYITITSFITLKSKVKVKVILLSLRKLIQRFLRRMIFFPWISFAIYISENNNWFTKQNIIFFYIIVVWGNKWQKYFQTYYIQLMLYIQGYSYVKIGISIILFMLAENESSSNGTVKNISVSGKYGFSLNWKSIRKRKTLKKTLLELSARVANYFYRSNKNIAFERIPKIFFKHLV